MVIKRFIGWKHYIKFILVFSFVAILLTNQIILRDFPNSADEYSYLISAKLFSTGKLSVPSPPQKQFFNFFHVINDGKFYGKYSPGWPFFLMLGVLINFPMIVNLIFSILTLLLVYSIAKNFFSEKIARIALLFMATSPYFVLNSASYFSHPSSLFFLSLFAYLYIKNLKESKSMNWFLLGIVLSVSFNIRQLDALVIGVCFLIHYIFIIKKNQKPIKTEVKNSLLFLSGFLLLLSLFLLYNYLQTGNALLTPFSKYNPLDKLGFNNGFTKSFSWALENNIYKRLLSLNIWVPFSSLFMLFSLFKYNHRRKYLLLFIFLSLFFAYFFYALPQGNEYGPRYLYSSSFAIFILMAAGFERLTQKKYFWLLLIIVLSNIILFVYLSSLFHNQINQRVELYDKVKNGNISNAIVFLNCSSTSMCSGTMPSMDLTRNGIYFNNSVLYVRDLKDKNSLLAEIFPDRKYYLGGCENIRFKFIDILNFWKSENVDCKIARIYL